MVNTSWAGYSFVVGHQDHRFQVKSAGAGRQEELAAHPSRPCSWYLIFEPALCHGGHGGKQQLGSSKFI